MNREYKFRAWNDIAKEMYYMDRPFWEGEYDMLAFNGYLPCDVLDNLEQYTGLKDKNGKEIYEGDVCQIWARIVVDLDKCESFLLDPMPIEYHGSRFVLIDKKNEQALELAEYINTLEIIGNIHEVTI